MVFLRPLSCVKLHSLEHSQSSCLPFNTQNHRGFWVGRDPQGPLSPAADCAQDSPKNRTVCWRALFKCSLTAWATPRMHWNLLSHLGGPDAKIPLSSSTSHSLYTSFPISCCCKALVCLTICMCIFTFANS